MSEKVIFWDFDGTLIYPNESFLYALTTSLADAGYALDEEEGRAFLRDTCTWYSPYKAHTDAVGEEWWRQFFEKLAAFCAEKGFICTDPDRISELFRRTVCDPECYKVYDDAAEALRITKALGYDNIIISNNFPELSVIAEAFGLDEYISAYVLSSCVGYEKPRREIYDHARALAGNPSECWMVGDNPVADAEGAVFAGINAIPVHTQNAEYDGLIDVAREFERRSKGAPGLIRALDASMEQVMAFRDEFLNAGEMKINGSRGLHNYADYDEWRQLVLRCAEPDNDLIGAETSTWFAIADDRMIGCIELRHSLTPSLELIGGHIGYSVSPECRRRGYASQMLSQVLEKARALGIGRVLLTVDAGNIASIKTIERCGGVREQCIYSLDGEEYYKYWIELT